MVRPDTSWFTRSASNCSWPTTPRQPLKKLNAARVRALDARVMGRCGLEGVCDVQARSRAAPRALTGAVHLTWSDVIAIVSMPSSLSRLDVAPNQRMQR
jgi:hypothetical protein